MFKIKSYCTTKNIMLVLLLFAMLQSIIKIINIPNSVSSPMINQSVNPFGEITPSNPFVGKLIIPDSVNLSEIKTINIMMANYKHSTTSDIQIMLKDVVGNILFNKNIHTGTIKDNTLYPLEIPKNKLNSRNLILSVDSANATDGNAITLYLDNNGTIGYSLGFYQNNNMVKIFIFMITFCILLLLGFLSSKLLNLQYYFVVVALLCGFMFVITNPIGGGADEPAHYSRAVSIFDGNLLNTPSSSIPNNSIIYGASDSHVGVVQFTALKEYYSKLISKSDESGAASHIGSQLYSPVNYIPQIIGMNIAKIVVYNKFALVYGGRIMNLLAYILIGFIAIKILPTGKEFLCAFLLLPMPLYQASSLSADMINIALCILFISIVIRCVVSINKMSLGYLVALCAIAIALGLCKQTSIIVVLSVLLIPPDKFKSRIHKYVFAGCCITVSIVSYVVWMRLISNNGIMQAYMNSVHLSQHTFATPGLALFYIIKHPLEFISILIQTFRELGLSYLKGSVGVLSWVNVFLDSYYYYLIAILLLLSLCIISTLQINKFIRTMASILFVCFVIMTFLSLFIAWTPIGANIIHGVQGRYFLPIFFLLFVILGNNSLINYQAQVTSIVKILSVICLNNAILSLVIYYYT